jgi:primase-polymerase (primpol)-like protein
MVEPEYSGEIGWQTDMHSYDSKDTLFDCIKKLNKSKSKKNCAFKNKLAFWLGKIINNLPCISGNLLYTKGIQ